jgi:hypothetical protein
VRGCKSRRSGPLSREGSLSCHTCCFPVSSEGPPHSVAYYDSLGYVEDLFLPGSSRGRTVEKLFTVLRLAQEFFSYMESSPLPVIVRPAQEYFIYMEIE